MLRQVEYHKGTYTPSYIQIPRIFDILKGNLWINRYISYLVTEYRASIPYTACPRSSYPFHIVAYYIRWWVTTSWTDDM